MSAAPVRVSPRVGRRIVHAAAVALIAAVLAACAWTAAPDRHYYGITVANVGTERVHDVVVRYAGQTHAWKTINVPGAAGGRGAYVVVPDDIEIAWRRPMGSIVHVVAPLRSKLPASGTLGDLRIELSGANLRVLAGYLSSDTTTREYRQLFP